MNSSIVHSIMPLNYPLSPLFSPAMIASILHNPSGSSPACSSPRSPPSSSPSPSSTTFSLRFQKPSNNECPKGGVILNRKRPARINIPTSMSLCLVDTPKDEKVVIDTLEVEENGYSVYCKRGRRGYAMEDRYSALVDLQGDSKQAFFGVFDGHGGAKAAEFAANKIGKNIMDQVSKRREEEVKEAIKDGYLMTDKEHLGEGIGGGTCCVTALIQNDNLIVSNAGDCRAVMSVLGNAEALTFDHRPSREDERNRITTMGGYVDKSCGGVWRIEGSLAVSRGIGDQHLKQWVISEPETKVIRINKSEYEFLILASDGLWDRVSNQEAVDVVRRSCIGADHDRRIESKMLFSACKELVELSVTRGSIDDISVVIIDLGCFVS